MSAQPILLRAIHARLTTSGALTDLVGPDGVRDRILPRMRLPCVVYGRMESRDYSTATEESEEHLLTLGVWSDGEGRAGAQAVAGLVRSLLHRADLPLAGVQLVTIACLGMESRRDDETRLNVIDLRFRAVTE